MTETLSKDLPTEFIDNDGATVAVVRIDQNTQTYAFKRSRLDLSGEQFDRKRICPAIVLGGRVVDILVDDVWHEVEPV